MARSTRDFWPFSRRLSWCSVLACGLVLGGCSGSSGGEMSKPSGPPPDGGGPGSGGLAGFGAQTRSGTGGAAQGPAGGSGGGSSSDGGQTSSGTGGAGPNPGGGSGGGGGSSSDGGSSGSGMDRGQGGAGQGGAGGASSAGGGGATVATDCTGNPAHFLCVDFENLAAGAAPKGLDVPAGGAHIVEDASVSGTHSLRFDWADGDKRLTSRNVPGKHWGRVYLRVEVCNNGPNGYMHSCFVESNLTRMVDAVNRPDGKHNWKYNVGHPAFPDTPYRYQWDKTQWICAEWHSEPDVGANGHWAFFLDGQPVPELTGEFNIARIPQTYAWLKFGVVVFQGGARVAGWMDDIVISSERVGCNLKPTK